MYTPHSYNPNLGQVASQAQSMARSARQENLAIAFQSVAMVSMAIMSVAAAAHLVREFTRREQRPKGRG